MRKLFSFFAAALVALAVNAQTDFAAPGYKCAADDAVLTGSASASKFYLYTESEPHYIGWNDVANSSNSVATWTVTATRGCYVSVTLDLGPVVANNKHVFEVKILDEQGHPKGTVAEGLPSDNGGDGYPGDYDKEKLLDGTILLPVAGVYTVELRNIRDYGKGSVKSVIITYDSDAPAELVDVTDVELNKDEVTLDLEEVELLVATVLPDDATDPTVTWSSSDKTVATVSETGLVTAIAEGTAYITAQAGEHADICEVTVAAAPVPDVDFASPYILAGKVAHLNGAIWKNDNYKLYGDGGHNINYGTATWTLNVTRPCRLTGALNGVEGGHLFALDLYQGEDSLGTLVQPESAKWWSGIIDMNDTLVIPAAGQYTFKLRNTQEWSSGKVESIILTALAEPEPKFYITGTANLVGNDKEWHSDAIAVTEDSYTFTNLAAGAYKMKVTLDGTWDEGKVKGVGDLTARAEGIQDINGNIGFILDAPGDVTVTYTADPAVFTVEGDIAATPIYKIYFAQTEGWAEDGASTAVYDATEEKINVNIVNAKVAQWQGQIWYKDIVAKAGKRYDVSLKIKATKNIGGVIVKYQDAQNIFSAEGISLVADEAYELIKTDVDGKDGGDGMLIFDFGYAPAETQIEIYDIAIVEKDAPVIDLENGFYLIGRINGVDGWNIEDLAAEQKFSGNPSNPSEFIVNATLVVGDEIQVVNVLDNAITAWFPGGEGNNYVVDDAHAGEKTVYFRPDKAGDEAWWHGCIYIDANTTGVEETDATVKAVKVIENGQIVIIKNGVRLNILGTQF